MSETFHCDDKETLMAFLYGEIDPSARKRVEDHLRRCAACAHEIDALTTVRTELATWAPPDRALGGFIGGTPADAVRPVPWWAEVPAWAQVAAATLVLAASASIANVQVHSGPEGLVVSTGWMRPTAAPAQPSAQAVPLDDQAWRTALAALESKLRDEMAPRGGHDQPAAAIAVARGGDSEALLRQIRTMLDESERRQRQELALRITQLNRDMDIQRRADLVRIEQGLGQVEGRTGAEMARQRQMLNYVMRVSAPQQ